MSLLTICLIIFALTVIGYCSGKYSLATFAVTALMALSLTGCLDADTALKYFSNSNVVMVGGMCVVAAGFNRTKFCTDIAMRISQIAKGSMNKMMFGYVLIGVLLSQFIQSPVVVFSIVAPMLAASAESLGIKASKVMFPLGAATVITCCALPIGAGATVPSEINGYIESYGYTTYMIGFLQPMIARLPMLIVSIIYCAFFATRFAPDEPPVAGAAEMKKMAAKDVLKPLQEYAGVIIFFADAVALMFSGTLGLDSWQISVMGALAMVLLGVLKPKEASSALPMNILLLIAGSSAISGALSATGAGEAIGSRIAEVVNALNGNSYAVGFIFFIVPFIMTQFMSNRGTMIIFYPIAIATCAAINADPTGLMIMIQAACLASFMTPMATSAIPYIMSYGGYDQKSLIKQSWPLSILCCIFSVGWIMTIYPLK